MTRFIKKQTTIYKKQRSFISLKQKILNLHSLDLNMGHNQNRPLIGVACVLQRNGEILLGQRKGAHYSGYWGMPGGHLELGETITECAQRELKEETGMIALSSQVIHWEERIHQALNKHYVTFYVLIDNFSGEPSILEPDKCAAWQWFDIQFLPQPMLYSDLFIKNLLSNLA